MTFPCTLPSFFLCNFSVSLDSLLLYFRRFFVYLQFIFASVFSLCSLFVCSPNNVGTIIKKKTAKNFQISKTRQFHPTRTQSVLINWVQLKARSTRRIYTNYLCNLTSFLLKQELEMTTFNFIFIVPCIIIFY